MLSRQHPADLIGVAGCWRLSIRSRTTCWGGHPAHFAGSEGTVIRAFHPDAVAASVLRPDQPPTTMRRLYADRGFFVAFIPKVQPTLAYRLRFDFADGASFEADDPYRFLPTLGDLDQHLFNEGQHRRLWEKLGAHPTRMDGVDGVAFAVWAPSAARVSVIGDFCRWDGRVRPMRSLGSSGIFELFVPGIGEGTLYKFEIKTKDGHLRVKSDPVGLAMEMPPKTASRVYVSHHQWQDHDWMERRPHRDITREPLAIYEVHLGSWARVPEEGGRSLTYREIAPRLVEHIKRFGFNAIELLPVAEHPFDGSWGYQVTGYYAPTSRYGTPDDFRYFVDCCHQHGVWVLCDWVPGHFVQDDFALRRFDGTALYEHEDTRRGHHPDWGTLIFNYDRHEVRNFLIANAIYWLREFHIDGLRVDAVASMLYLDYSRQLGEWVPNHFGGNENLEAIHFLKQFNEIVRQECPGCFTVAEESTAWPGVSWPVSSGGLGFTFKWNMGWMHDTLVYFSKDPVHRKYHHDQLTFAMIYEYTERYIMPMSHDEVVHGKGHLLDKMPGDEWQKFANLRTLLTYQFTRPGKKLLFMGSELAPYGEWRYWTSLDWHLNHDPKRIAFQRFLEDLGCLYHEQPCLWRSDPDHTGCCWIDCGDYENSVISYYRRDGDNIVVVVANLTPVPRDDYRVGAPEPGRYACRLCSDASAYGGSNYPAVSYVESEPIRWHGRDHSLKLVLPPLGALVYVYQGR